MKYSNTIEYNIVTKMDKAGLTQFNTAIKNAQAELQRIFSKSDTNNFYSRQALTRDSKNIAELQNIVNSAFNVRTGTVDYTKAISNMAKTGKNFAGSLAMAGGAGKELADNLVTGASQVNDKLKLSTILGEKLTNTLGNTARWMAVSMALQGVLSAVADASQYIKQLDESLTQITMVSGQSRDNMKEFAAYANEAAKGLGSATTDYTNAVKVFIQEGFTVEESKTQATQATILGNVSEQDTATTADQITAYRNAFGLSIEEMDTSLDKIANIANKTAANVNELMTASQRAASTASSVGASEDSFLASVATIQSVTREGAEQIGNGLKSIYTRFADIKMGDDTEDGVSYGQYSSALKAVGVDIVDNSGEVKTMDQILSELQTVWKDLSQTEKLAVGEKVAGRYQYNRFAALMNNQEYYDKAYSATQTSSGAMEQMQEDYMESLAAKGQKIATNFETIFTSIYNSGVVEKVADVLVKITNAFATLGKQLDQTIPLLTTLITLFAKIGGGKFLGKKIVDIGNYFSNIKRGPKDASNNSRILQEMGITAVAGRSQEDLQRMIKASKGMTKKEKEEYQELTTATAQAKGEELDAAIQQTRLVNKKRFINNYKESDFSTEDRTEEEILEDVDFLTEGDISITAEDYEELINKREKTAKLRQQAGTREKSVSEILQESENENLFSNEQKNRINQAISDGGENAGLDRIEAELQITFESLDELIEEFDIEPLDKISESADRVSMSLNNLADIVENLNQSNINDVPNIDNDKNNTSLNNYSKREERKSRSRDKNPKHRKQEKLKYIRSKKKDINSNQVDIEQEEDFSAPNINYIRHDRHDTIEGYRISSDRRMAAQQARAIEQQENNYTNDSMRQQNVQSVTEVIGAGAEALMSGYGSMNSIKNAIDILNDSAATTEEKMSAVGEAFVTVSFGAITLIDSIKSLYNNFEDFRDIINNINNTDDEISQIDMPTNNQETANTNNTVSEAPTNISDNISETSDTFSDEDFVEIFDDESFVETEPSQSSVVANTEQAVADTMESETSQAAGMANTEQATADVAETAATGGLLATLGPLLIATLALAAAGAALALIIPLAAKELDKMNYTIEEAQEDSTLLEERISSLNSKLSDFTDTLTSMEETLNELNGLAKNSAEWTSAISEINGNMTELISDYNSINSNNPMLANRDWIIDEDGIMQFTAEGRTKYEQTIEKEIANAYQGKAAIDATIVKAQNKQLEASLANEIGYYGGGSARQIASSMKISSYGVYNSEVQSQNNQTSGTELVEIYKKYRDDINEAMTNSDKETALINLFKEKGIASPEAMVDAFSNNFSEIQTTLLAIEANTAAVEANTTSAMLAGVQADDKGSLYSDFQQTAIATNLAEQSIDKDGSAYTAAKEAVENLTADEQKEKFAEQMGYIYKNGKIYDENDEDITEDYNYEAIKEVVIQSYMTNSEYNGNFIEDSYSIYQKLLELGVTSDMKKESVQQIIKSNDEAFAGMGYSAEELQAALDMFTTSLQTAANASDIFSESLAGAYGLTSFLEEHTNVSEEQFNTTLATKLYNDSTYQSLINDVNDANTDEGHKEGSVFTTKNGEETNDIDEAIASYYNEDTKTYTIDDKTYTNKNNAQKVLKAASSDYNKATKALDKYKKAQAKLYAQTLRVDKGMTNLGETFDDDNEILKTANKNTAEYAESLTNIKNIIADLTGVESENLLGNLLDEDSLDNTLNLLDRIKQGGDDAVAAYDELIRATADEIDTASNFEGIQIGEDFIKSDEIDNQLNGMIQSLDGFGSEAEYAGEALGEDINGMINTLQQQVNQGKISLEDYKTYLDAAVAGTGYHWEEDDEANLNSPQSETATEYTISLPNAEGTFEGEDDNIKLTWTADTSKTAKGSVTSSTSETDQKIPNYKLVKGESSGETGARAGSKSSGSSGGGGSSKKAHRQNSKVTSTPRKTTSTAISATKAAKGKKNSSYKDSKGALKREKTLKETQDTYEKLDKVISNMTKQQDRLYGTDALRNLEKINEKEKERIQNLKDTLKWQKKVIEANTTDQGTQKYRVKISDKTTRTYSVTRNKDSEGNYTLYNWAKNNKNKNDTRHGDTYLASNYYDDEGNKVGNITKMKITGIDIDEKTGKGDYASYQKTLEEIQDQAEAARVKASTVKDEDERAYWEAVAEAREEDAEALKTAWESNEEAIASYEEYISSLVDAYEEAIDAAREYIDQINEINDAIRELTDTLVEFENLQGKALKAYIGAEQEARNEYNDTLREAQSKGYAGGGPVSYTNLKGESTTATNELEKNLALMNEMNNIDSLLSQAGVDKLWEDYQTKVNDTSLEGYAQKDIEEAQTAYTTKVRQVLSAAGYDNDIIDALSDKDRKEVLKEYYEQVVESYDEAIALRDDLKDSITNLQETVDEKIATVIDQQQQMIDHLSTILDVESLIEGENNFNTQADIYSKQIDTLKEQYQTLQLKEEFAAANYQRLLDQNADIDSEEMQSAIEEMEEVQENQLDVQQQILETSQALLESQVSQTTEDLLSAMGLSDLDWLINSLEGEANVQEGYYDQTESGYNIQKLKREYQSLLNDTTDASVQQMITEQMKEQIGYLEEKAQINEDNVALSEYEVEYANKQLEILKAQIALRDAEANKSQMRLKRNAAGNYSYVYAANEDDIEDKQQALLDAQYDAYELSKTTYKDTVNNYLSSLQELKTSIIEVATDTSLSVEEKLQRVSQLMKNATQMANQMGQTVSEVSNSQLFNEMVKILNGLDSDVLENSGISQLLNDNGSLDIILNTDFYNDLTKLLGLAEQNIEGFDLTDKIKSLITDYQNAEDTVADEIVEIGEDYTAINQEYIEKLGVNSEKIDSATTELKNMTDSLDALQEILKQYTSTEDGTTSTLEQSLNSVAKKLLKANGMTDKELEAAGFDTGGYTGTWTGSGVDNKGGKWAILHQKELVLNADQTEDIMNAVQYAASVAKLQAETESFKLAAEATKSEIISNFDEFNQPVVYNEIYADFPAAESAAEIKQALLSLENDTYQYINKNVDNSEYKITK